MKRLFLIDAYALIYRFHYAFITSPMRNPQGQNVSAVWGFVKFLNELIERENPQYLGVAFDPRGGNFRHKLFDQYKANREATPEDIIAATPIIKDILAAMRIPVLEVPNYEADDVIGTLCRRAAATGEFTTYMVTPDKDYGQLVCPKCFMYKPGKGGSGIEIWGEAEVCANFGISKTLQVIDILAIWGDASDNIPGVVGIGAKGAAKLIAEFGSVEGVISGVESIKGKTRERIENSIDMLRLSKELATICLDVPIEFSPNELIIETPDNARLRAIYREHNFRYFLQQLDSDDMHFGAIEGGGNAMKIEPTSYSAQKAAEATQGSLFDTPSTVPNATPSATPPSNIQLPPRIAPADSDTYSTIDNSEHNYICVNSIEELKLLIQRLSSCATIAFDTETTNIDPLRADLVGISFAMEAKTAYWIPTIASNRKLILELLKPIFENDSIAKIGQNIKYDMLVLSLYDIEVKGFLHDTMIMHYLLDAEGRHSMDAMARNFLNYSPIPISQLIGSGTKQLSMEQVAAPIITDYAAEDADITLQLFEKLTPLLGEISNGDLYSKIEEPLISVLCDMERVGVKIDTSILATIAVKLNAKLSEIESTIYSLAQSNTININSPKQLGILLFEQLELNAKAKKTKTGQYKTDEETLNSLRGKHPIIEQILEYRGIKKLLSTYVEALPLLINPRTNRLHTSFNQATTATGRLSSSNPNIQNIPIREEMGREIRRAFVAENSDCVIIAADYSQIELRIMAHLSGDKALQQAFLNDEDIHTATAAKIFGVTHNEVTKEQRRKAKTANFGIIYGISTFGLAQRLSIPRGEATELIEGYFRLYGGVKEYMERVKSDAKERGYVETLFGRRRYLSDINSSNATIRGLAERNAINAPIQGSAADIMKLAMIAVHAEIKHQKLESKVILQIHDEIVIEAHRSEVERVREILNTKMAQVVELSVPLTIDIGVGDNWLEAH